MPYKLPSHLESGLEGVQLLEGNPNPSSGELYEGGLITEYLCCKRSSLGELRCFLGVGASGVEGLYVLRNRSFHGERTIVRPLLRTPGL